MDNFIYVQRKPRYVRSIEVLTMYFVSAYYESWKLPYSVHKTKT